MKKYNICRRLYEEIEKGNLYILTNGNIVGKDDIIKDIKKKYLKHVEKGTIDMNISLSQYIELEINNYVTCYDVIKELKKKYNIDYKEGKKNGGL